MKVLIDTDELAEYFNKGWGEVGISSADDMKYYLAEFCMMKIAGSKEEDEESEKEERAKVNQCVAFDSITYFTRDQAQKYLEVLRDALAAMGKVSIRDYYRFAEFLQILPKWTAMYFNEDYGWTDLSTARISSVHSRGIDLWTLEMPEPKKLDI